MTQITTTGLLLITLVNLSVAQDTVFFDGFESGDTSGWRAPAPVGETGMVSCFDLSGTAIPCLGTGQDAEFKPGVAWPDPRFVDNGDGTVTDMLTGLGWVRISHCNGGTNWFDAMMDASLLAHGWCGLTDGSVMGDWRLPSVKELESLVAYQYLHPAVANSAGTGQWTEGDVFSFVRDSSYWTSTTNPQFPDDAFKVNFGWGKVSYQDKTSVIYSWYVRNSEETTRHSDTESRALPLPWVPAPVGATGQETCYDQAGNVVTCSGGWEDGDLRPGVAWPVPRFVDNSEGTVTDMLTGLVWLKDADCFSTRRWDLALSDASTLASGACGLSDGSLAGDWRLPTIREMVSLLDCEYSIPTLSDAEGTGQWSEGDVFQSVQTATRYWSSTTGVETYSDDAWSISFYSGFTTRDLKYYSQGVWPVRNGLGR